MQGAVMQGAELLAATTLLSHRTERQDRGTDDRGTDRDPDDGPAAATGPWPPSGLTLSGVRPDLGQPVR
jgi:hypothetical protein